MTHQVELGLNSSPYIKVGKGHPLWGTGSQKPDKHQGQVQISLIAVLQTHQSTQSSHACKGPKLVPCKLVLTVCPESMCSHELRSMVSVGSPIMTLIHSLAVKSKEWDLYLTEAWLLLNHMERKTFHCHWLPAGDTTVLSNVPLSDLWLLLSTTGPMSSLLLTHPDLPVLCDVSWMTPWICTQSWLRQPCSSLV